MPNTIINGNAARELAGEAAVPPTHRAHRLFLAVHTVPARRLLTGRAAHGEQPAILGLFGFADRLRVIWQAAKVGDVYARWWLLKVEVAINKAEADLKAEHSKLRGHVKESPLFDVEVSGTAASESAELTFACPYAYWGARLLANLDGVMLTVGMLVQTGLQSRAQGARYRHRCERAVRASFCSAQGFHRFNLTRAALEAHSAEVRDAEAAMGALPDAVRSGAAWPALLDRPHAHGTVGAPS